LFFPRYAAAPYASVAADALTAITVYRSRLSHAPEPRCRAATPGHGALIHAAVATFSGTLALSRRKD